MHLREVEVGPDEVETRLDRFLTRTFPDLTRSFVQKLIASGNVLVNGRPARANLRPLPGMRISVAIPEPEPTALRPTPLPLAIVYEDDDIVVVDKPAGLVVHPAPGHATDTLVNALLARYPHLSTGNALRPGIVHRLDKDTSGLLVVARNDRALHVLQSQMQRHEVLKEYLALVCGTVRPDQGTIEAPIGRHPIHRQRMAVVERGREARTHFRVLERFRAYTLVAVQLETGRTHQIRVHFNALGHPVVGDPVYGRGGDLGLTRQFLHAHRLGFHRPSDGEWVVFESPLPHDLAAALDRLREQP